MEKRHYLTYILYKREKARDLTQSCDKSTYTHRKSKKQRDNIKHATKTLITQRLRTDLGRSVGVTAVTQLVWLNRVYERSTFPLSAKVV